MLKMLKSIGFFEADRAMSDQPETKQKREYRKGNPLTKTELNKRADENKRKSHKLIRTFVPYAFAEEFKVRCQQEGMTFQDAVYEAMQEYYAKHFDDQ
ncbi:hypothetical protein CYD30_19940 [Kosakonia cowanii]|nr:hypothetical protein CYD30_19940 [Kosakonia cowanii]